VVGAKLAWKQICQIYLQLDETWNAPWPALALKVGIHSFPV